ncbi:type I secretion system permease/ATPase [Sulfitobacter sp. D35]|uniref:type I secretion system permease/ATPase n=1 Tax=Sulfitobacter sp. D35 TaxID=3083252 RepID=UPI00296E4DE6|nr:type I secretion system permease/ATPase [Sulfitobacter sp. D35]MDW4496602.1 type I secretion system permease/ATPase [Sulfitobacter sp. D35]
MTQPLGTASAAVPGDTDSDAFALVAWYARAFGRPYTEAALRARLAGAPDLTDPDQLARALAGIGLRSRLVLRDPARLDPIALPFLLFRKDGGPLVMTGLSQNRKLATVLDPEADWTEREVPVRKLRRTLKPGVLLVTPREDGSNAMLSPESVAPDRGHWFWGPVRANWPNWVQVMVAALLLNLMSLALPLFVMNVYDKVIPNLAYVTLWTLAGGVAIALGLDLLMRTIRANILETIGRRVDVKVASRLFSQAMGAQLLQRPGGAAGIASTIRDFEVVREFFASASFVAFIDLLFIGIFVAVLWLIVGPIALVPLVAVPAVLVIALLAQLPIGRTAARAQQMATKRHVVLVESLSGIETIKSLNAEPAMQREWENAVAASARITGRTRFWSNVAANGTMLVQQTVSVVIIVWGVFLVSEGRITIGGLIAANILAGRVLAPLGTIAQTIFRAQYAFKSLAALDRFMALPRERAGAVSSTLRVTKGALEIRGASFTYPDAQVPALSDLTFSIASGEAVALLGKVGSGKTTAGKLIAGLIAPDSGTVLVDGIALDQYEPAELRRGIGYLPQNPELFTGTLRENLAIARPGAQDEALMRALYFAGMDGYVETLPEGLDHFVGEQGRRLSGGQRQGISLARLLLREPKLLFLDEPTNAMDQRMETQVIGRLAELNRKGTGLIVCTHRQSLAGIAARMMVMDQGRVVLDGPRAQVLGQLRSLSAAREQG